MNIQENLYRGPFSHGALISMTYTGDSQGCRECCISRNAASCTERDRENTMKKRRKLSDFRNSIAKNRLALLLNYKNVLILSFKKKEEWHRRIR